MVWQPAAALARQVSRLLLQQACSTPDSLGQHRHQHYSVQRLTSAQCVQDEHLAGSGSKRALSPRLPAASFCVRTAQRLTTSSLYVRTAQRPTTSYEGIWQALAASALQVQRLPAADLYMHAAQRLTTSSRTKASGRLWQRARSRFENCQPAGWNADNKLLVRQPARMLVLPLAPCHAGQAACSPKAHHVIQDEGIGQALAASSPRSENRQQQTCTC